MTTVRDIVTRAMLKIGVSSEDEAPSDAGMSNGVDALNMMLAAWKLAGVDTSHTALTENSTFPLAAEYEEGTVYMLASRMASDYNVPQSFDADDWFRKIQAAYMTITASSMPNALIYTPSRKARDGTLGTLE